MTEDEAKQKWCPFVRVLVAPDNATWQGQMLTNRGDIPADNTHVLCIGSGCMAWVETNSESIPNPPYFKPAGYCGLARR